MRRLIDRLERLANRGALDPDEAAERLLERADRLLDRLERADRIDAEDAADARDLLDSLAERGARALLRGAEDALDLIERDATPRSRAERLLDRLESRVDRGAIDADEAEARIEARLLARIDRLERRDRLDDADADRLREAVAALDDPVEALLRFRAFRMETLFEAGAATDPTAGSGTARAGGELLSIGGDEIVSIASRSTFGDAPDDVLPPYVLPAWDDL